MNRIRHIDGLRAIAVLAVVLYHSAIVRPHPDRSGMANFFLGQGCHGVELFFVLSGFCLAYPSLAKLSNTAGTFDVARYAAHRLVRILPPCYIALGVFVLLFAVTHTHPERLAPDNLLRQIAFMDRGTDFVNPSFWTLPIELRWYVLMPVALWAWVRAPKAFLVALVLLIVGSEQTRAGSLDLVSLPGFLLGIAAAHLYVRRTAFDRFALPLCLVSFAVTMLVAPTRELYGSIQIPWEVTAALFVVAAGANPFLRRALSLPALTYVGAASYSIYLVHEPLMEFAEAHGATQSLAVVLGILGGAVFWALAERPFIRSRLRDALVSKIEPVARDVLRTLGVAGVARLSPPVSALRFGAAEIPQSADETVPA